MGVMAEPLHTTWLVGETTTNGVGFTVTVKLCVVPIQVLAVGVTAIIAVAFTLDVFTAVNDGIGLDVPELVSPIEVLLFVQA